MTFDRLLAQLRPHRWRLALSFLLMLGDSAAVLVLPWIGGLIAGSFLSETHDLNMSILAPALLGLLALQAGFLIAQRRVLAETGERLVAGLRSEIYSHLQMLPIPYLQDRRRGDLLSLLTHEVEVLSEFVTVTLVGLLPRLVTFVGALVLMLRIDPILALPVILGAPAFFILLKIVGRRIRPLSGRMRDAYGGWVSVAEQNLSVMPAIKSYTREGLEAARLDDAITVFRDLSVRLQRIQSILGPLLQFLAAAAVVGVLWLASDQVGSGQMTPAELVTFLLYSALLTRPLSGLADVWGQYQHALGALSHMSAVFSTQPEALDSGTVPETVRGEIGFESVSFAYPDRPQVLCKADFCIAAGERVAISGENGAGKSTLLELLLRFQTPSSGRILLDGQDIADLNLRALRQAIAVVPQQVALIDGTIEENVHFGRPDATLAEISTALHEADADGLIASLPDGLQTRIGERGIRLSGGQRQRLALARALLKKPAILVFDEATAMFDPAGEARFVAIASKALAGRTLILITHRPASLVLADRVLKLEGGRMVEHRAAALESLG